MRCYGLTVPGSGSEHRFCVPTVTPVFPRPNRPNSRISFPKATLKNEGFVVELSFYELLGIPESGSLIEIKNAYKQLARKYHPDVSPPDRVDEFTKRFIRVQEAYETLSDPSRRAMYDRDMAKGINFAFTARRRYNYHDQAYFSEIDHTLNKLTTMYFVSKILAEKEGWKFAKEHGMDFVTIIPTLVVGPFLIPSMPPSLITALSPITRNEEHYSIIKQGSPPSSRIF